MAVSLHKVGTPHREKVEEWDYKSTRIFSASGMLIVDALERSVEHQEDERWTREKSRDNTKTYSPLAPHPWISAVVNKDFRIEARYWPV
jgi:hypothetical protein